MKKIIIIFIVPFLIFGQDFTYVPDDNFEERLIDLGFDDIVDILGRSSTNINETFQLYIYNDGSIEKKYLIK